MGKNTMTDPERRFVSAHIRRHRKMGMSRKQSIAVALHEARDKGYDIPPPKAVRQWERSK
jgi:hypothetical protein